MKPVIINSRTISDEQPPFIIAEMSANHDQSLDKALKMVETAKDCGVDAIKLQTYTPDTMTIRSESSDFKINEDDNIWKGSYLYDLYKKAQTPWEWHEKIFQKCKALDLTVFSTPFDETAVDFLETLTVPCYKIASFENTDLLLLKKVAKTGKPVIMSTGMATAAEIDNAVTTLRTNGCDQIILLKCTSTYPASPAQSNIKTIPHMKQLFRCHIGLSDHTPGIGVSVASVALGACVIEKHFTLSRADEGVDAAFSLEPQEFKTLVSESKNAFNALGDVSYGPTKSEKNSLKYRRSIYIVKDIKAGEIITENHVKSIRPGFGLSTKYFELVLGKKIKKDAKKGAPLTWELLL